MEIPFLLMMCGLVEGERIGSGMKNPGPAVDLVFNIHRPMLLPDNAGRGHAHKAKRSWREREREAANETQRAEDGQDLRPRDGLDYACASGLTRSFFASCDDGLSIGCCRCLKVV